MDHLKLINDQTFKEKQTEHRERSVRICEECRSIYVVCSIIVVAICIFCALLTDKFYAKFHRDFKEIAFREFLPSSNLSIFFLSSFLFMLKFRKKENITANICRFLRFSCNI